ncbi:MAG: EamA family transporter, partial [Elusimicrobia bacterium CG08_land_8_20_14_0_20_51_18]
MTLLLPLFSAFLFSLATPFSKVLLAGLSPAFIAGLSYFSSALGLRLYGFFRKKEESKILKKDWPNLFFIVLSGGVLAPLFLLKGLLLTKASSASILLNFEIVFTSLLAIAFFKEHGGGKLWAAVFLVFAGSFLLFFSPAHGFAAGKGGLFVVLAALMWAMDNNLTARISLKDPFTIAVIKGFAGGTVNLLISFLTESAGNLLPISLAGVFLMGVFSYGLSLILLIYSMRMAGAARAVAVFGAYPFMSFALSIIFLKEKLTAGGGAAFVLMLAALYLINSQRHGHRHSHDGTEHDHLHAHEDGHHLHGHEDVPPGAEHAHPHRHDSLEHSHEHLPDIH